MRSPSQLALSGPPIALPNSSAWERLETGSGVLDGRLRWDWQWRSGPAGTMGRSVRSSWSTSRAGAPGTYGTDGALSPDGERLTRPARASGRAPRRWCPRAARAPTWRVAPPRRLHRGRGTRAGCRGGPRRGRLPTSSPVTGGRKGQFVPKCPSGGGAGCPLKGPHVPKRAQMSLAGGTLGSASQAECRGFESLRPLQPKPRPRLDLRALAARAKCNGGDRVLTYALDGAACSIPPWAWGRQGFGVGKQDPLSATATGPTRQVLDRWSCGIFLRAQHAPSTPNRWLPPPVHRLL